MKLFRSFLPLLLVLLILLVSCGVDPPGNTNNTETSDILRDPAEVTLTDTAADRSVDRYTVSLPENTNVGEVAYCDGSIYFTTLLTGSGKQYDPSVALYRYDPESDKVEELYSFDEDQCVSELFVIGDDIFFEVNVPGPVKIVRYNTVSEKIDTIAEYQSGGDPILYSCGQYLLWYEHQSSLKIFAYDTIKGTTEVIAGGLSAYNAYSRPYVSDGILAYVTEEADCRVIHVYDVAEHKEITSKKVDRSILVARPQANREYIVFTGGYERSSPVYVYSMRSDRFMVLKDNRLLGAGFVRLAGSFVLLRSESGKKMIAVGMEHDSFSEVEVLATGDEMSIGYFDVSSDGTVFTCISGINSLVTISPADW